MPRAVRGRLRPMAPLPTRPCPVGGGTLENRGGWRHVSAVADDCRDERFRRGLPLGVDRMVREHDAAKDELGGRD